jgi:hypothetical protein
MNKLNKTLLIIFTVVMTGGIFSANAQVVYFNGLGRALVTSENLNGNILKADTAAGQAKDTTSKRKSTDGYTLFDLGVNAQPNETLRASAILRVRNAFGGFYGDGASLVFRQIRLDGIIAKKVKYEIGDIDLELTPYTLFNFNEMYHDYEADAFAIRRSVVAYENFNFGNKWRMQGFHAQSSFKFNKGIEKISVRGFATRTKKSNYLSSPDRLLFGGRLEILQSKFLQVGANLVRMVDLPQTAIDTLVNFKNNVATFDAKFAYGTDNFEFGLMGEFGFSKNSFRTKGVKDTIDGKDFFYDATLYAKYKPLNIKVYGSYREVGYFFSSPSAQTRRIYDYNAAGIPVGAHSPTLGNGMPAGSLFPLVNNNLSTRTPIMLDRMSDETARNTSIQTSLMNYLPQYNNITPYGQATPNRKGMTFGVSGGDVDRFIKADVIVDMLSEIVAEGTSDGETRKFMGVKGGAMFNLHKLLRFEKSIMLSGGIRYEQTTRGGVNDINFTSSIIDAGLTVEVVKQLDLIGGYKALMAKGNEFIAVRDQFNMITSFNSFIDMNQSQGLFAYGIRYRFSKNTYFTAQGISSSNKFSPSNTNYGINQLFLNYTMIF